jgi:hypothetical protein
VLAPGPDLTVAVWIKRSTVRKYHGALTTVRHYQHSSEDLLFAVLQNDLVIKSGAWGVSLRSPLPASLDSWVHVALTHAATGGTRMFVAGQVVAEAAGQQDQPLGEVPLLVGAAAGADVNHVIQHFFGAVDDLLIYDRALGDAEIAALAAGRRPR